MRTCRTPGDFSEAGPGPRRRNEDARCPLLHIRRMSFVVSIVCLDRVGDHDMLAMFPEAVEASVNLQDIFRLSNTGSMCWLCAAKLLIMV